MLKRIKTISNYISYYKEVEETTYDLLGREVTIADALGSLTYTVYDTEGQVTGMTQTSGEEEQSDHLQSGTERISGPPDNQDLYLWK